MPRPALFNQHPLLFPLLTSILLASSSALQAQQAPAGSNWDRVKALPVNTRLHVTTDHGGQTCRIFAVTDDALTCSQGSHTAGPVLQRAEIKHIKLTHYGRSTLVGAAVGGGIGATAGAIAGKTKPCTPGQLCLNGIGIGAGGVAAVFGVGAGILGAAVGGLTDITRGSSIYIRP